MALRRWSRDHQPLARWRGASAHGSVRRVEQGSRQTWFSIRRLDNLLRLHAGDRHGERPHNALFSPPRAESTATSITNRVQSSAGPTIREFPKKMAVMKHNRHRLHPRIATTNRSPLIVVVGY